MFGQNCNQSCGNCLNNEQCHHITGSCLSGCDSGYSETDCTEGNDKKINYNISIFFFCLGLIAMLENISLMETPFSVKRWLFWPLFDTHGHGAVRFLNMPHLLWPGTPLYNGHLRIPVIFTLVLFRTIYLQQPIRRKMWFPRLNLSDYWLWELVISSYVYHKCSYLNSKRNLIHMIILKKNSIVRQNLLFIYITNNYILHDIYCMIIHYVVFD